MRAPEVAARRAPLLQERLLLSERKGMEFRRSVRVLRELCEPFLFREKATRSIEHRPVLRRISPACLRQFEMRAKKLLPPIEQAISRAIDA